MAQIVGKIDSMYDKDIKTKFGQKKVYHAMVDGHDVNLGFKKEYEIGEMVTFEVEHKYGGLQLVNGRKGASGTTTVQPTVGDIPSGSGGKATAFPVNKNSKDHSIIRQNSLTHASRVVHDYYTITGKQPTESLDEYVESVIDMAYIFCDFSTGHREAKMSSAMAAYQTQMEQE